MPQAKKGASLQRLRDLSLALQAPSSKPSHKQLLKGESLAELAWASADDNSRPDSPDAAIPWELVVFLVSAAFAIARLVAVVIGERQRFYDGPCAQGCFVAYLKYRFGYWYAWTQGSSAVLLCGLTVGLMLIGGVVLRALDGAETLASSLWLAWCWIAAPDGGGSAETPFGRFVGIFVSCGGMLIFALLMSVISSSFEDMLAALREGRIPIIEANHVVILGWSPVALPLVRELCLGAESRGGTVISLLTESPKPDIEDDLKDSDINFGDSVITVRSGSTRCANDLEKVAVESASRIIVLSDPTLSREDADSKTINTLQTLRNAKWPAKGGALVVQCELMRNQRLFRSLCCAGSEALTTGDFVGRLMVQCSQQHGLASVIKATFGFDGDEFYIRTVKGMEGKCFQDAVFGLGDVIVVGMLLQDGEVQLLPPMSHTLTGNEQLILLAEDASTIPEAFGEEAAGRAEAMRSMLFAEEDSKGMNNWDSAYNFVSEAQHQTQLIVIVGWNESIGVVMDDLDRSVGINSKVIVYTPVSKAVRVEFLSSAQKRRAHTYQNITVEHAEGSLGARFKLEALPLCNAHKILILADISSDTASLADNQTLASILQIQDILQDSLGKKSLVIVPQIQQLQTEETCYMMGLQDVINSTQLTAQILALVSETPAMSGVVADFLSDTGVRFCIRRLSEYMRVGGDNLPSEVSFHDVMISASKSGETALGWSGVGGCSNGPWEMNPKNKTKRRSWTTDCRVVALRKISTKLSPLP